MPLPLEFVFSGGSSRSRAHRQSRYGKRVVDLEYVDVINLHSRLFEYNSGISIRDLLAFLASRTSVAA